MPIMKLVKLALLLLFLGAGLVVVSSFLYPQITLAPTKKPIKTSHFSLTKAPKKSLKGQIIDYSGEIKYQSRVATQAAELTNFSQKIQQGEDYFTEENSSLSLIFPNHVQLDLAENTELKIIQTLPTTMVFSQLNGEVEYQTLGEYPVSVRTAFLLTELRGNVLISRDSENSLVTIEVKSGEAKLGYNDLTYQSHTLTLKPKDTYVFNYDTRQGELK